MKIIHAQYMLYREGDGEASTDRYIRVIFEDGHDQMIYAKPFVALHEYLNSGGTLRAAPAPEVMQINLDMVAREAGNS